MQRLWTFIFSVILAVFTCDVVCISRVFADAPSTQERALSALDGKTIRSITVRVAPIFEGNNLGWLYSTANKLKIQTKESVIRQDLLIKEGDTFDHFRLLESERRLREQRFLRHVYITPKVDGNSVDLVVHVQDTWTIIPQGTFSNGGGSSKREIGLAESDLLGYGKRVEALIGETDNRRDIATVLDDQRFFGTRTRFVAAYFDREDGQRALGSLSLPFRSVVDPVSWSIKGADSNTVGRLFQFGDERYIYRQKSDEFSARITFAPNPSEKLTRRYSFGLQHVRNDFSQATLKDYRVLDLDPRYVSNDINGLPVNREYMGPVIGYESIESDFVSLAYIDRFERVEDYNLGQQFSAEAFIAPEFFGSKKNGVQLFANRSNGFRWSPTSFFRADVGVSTRLDDSDFNNTLLRGELKFYNILGPKFVGDIYLGKHTLASTLFLDYGIDLDRDRQLIVGAGNAIRGYEARAFAGNRRIGAIFEDRFTLVENILELMSLGGAVFAEAGGASNNSLNQILGSDIYSDVGVGLRFGFPRSTGGSVIRIDIAVPLRDGPDGTGRFEPRIVASAGQIFGAPNRSETMGAAAANVGVGVGSD